MLQLCYISRSEAFPDEQALKALLAQSRENNASLEITGLLLYKHGSFMQVIEGPEENIEQLFERISADDRHHSISELYREPISEREFAEWKMGFYSLDASRYASLDGLSDFLSPEADLTKFATGDPSRAKKMLLFFRKLS